VGRPSGSIEAVRVACVASTPQEPTVRMDGGSETAAVTTETASDEPTGFVATTSTRVVSPTSSGESAKEALVPQGAFVQSWPASSQSCHW
jgi:hypothetical protein